MDYEFENIHEYSRKRILEYRYRRSSGRLWLYSILSVALAVYYILRVPGYPVDWLFAAVFLGLAVYYLTWQYRDVKRGEKRARDFYNGKIPATCVRFGDRIQVTDVDSSLSLDYFKIEKVVGLKYGYYLLFAKRSVIPIDRNCFTKGDFESFRKFLKDRRPDLKIPE